MSDLDVGPSEIAELADEGRGTGHSVAELLRRRVRGAHEVDEFGLDVELIELLDPLFSLGWSIDVSGAERIPRTGPAVLVHNRRVGLSEPVAMGRGIRLATGRRPRFLGVPDIAPVGPFLRRMGGAVNRPEELHSLLRLGHVVSMSLRRNLRHGGRAGVVPAFALEPALALGVPVIPVAVIGREGFRSWRVVVGEPLPRLEGRGPLAMAELADEARFAVQELLDEATPPHWLFG